MITDKPVRTLTTVELRGAGDGYGCKVEVVDVTVAQWIHYWELWGQDYGLLPDEQKRNPGVVLAAKFGCFLRAEILSGYWWRIGDEANPIPLQYPADGAPMVVIKWASGVADDIVSADHETIPKNTSSRPLEQA